MSAYDVIIIGSGPGGYRAAILAALRGKSAVIIEKAQWGGCCLNRGCVPKKLLSYAAHFADDAAHVNALGFRAGHERSGLAQVTITPFHREDLGELVAAEQLVGKVAATDA